MKIGKMLKERHSVSFEVFPPKSEHPIEPLLDTLKHLYSLQPDFISVTYGAGGTNRGRNMEVIRSIIENGSTGVLAHFTCIGNSKEQIRSALQDYMDAGVENVLALRGDLPKGWTGTNGDFPHADELIQFLSSLQSSFSIGGACYPEKHLDAPTIESDLDCMLRKQDSGAEFFISQLCHDSNTFIEFLNRARKAGVTVPVLVGIMPVLNRDSTIRMAFTNGCSIPAPLSVLIGKYGDNPESFCAAGKEYTAEMVRNYLDYGVDGLHFYTMNRYRDIVDILSISGISKEG